MFINLIREVVEMCRNYVVFLGNNCIERKIVKYSILVGVCVRNVLFKSCFNF